VVNVDYVAVLADLEIRRAALDAAIASLKFILGYRNADPIEDATMAGFVGLPDDASADQDTEDSDGSI